MAACASPSQVIEPDVVYRKDIKLEVCAGSSCVKGTGLVVAPPGTEWQIKGSFPAAADKLSFKTCARYRPSNNEEDSWRYTYKPSALEQDPACAFAEIVAINNKGRHSFGGILFRSYIDTLQIAMDCNGETATDTTLVCQNYVGMPLKFRSLEPFSFYSGCGIPDQHNVKEIQFDMPRGICLIRVAVGGRSATALLAGFESDPMR